MRYGKRLPPLFLLCYALQSLADDSVIAYVKTVSGDATVIASDHADNAEVGSAIQIGNTLQTGENGSIGITFKDDTVMSFGPNTRLTVDEFLYAPEQGQLKLAVELLEGTLHYISGVIAKLNPEAISVKTPSGVIGVRGTRFLVKAGDE